MRDAGTYPPYPSVLITEYLSTSRLLVYGHYNPLFELI